MVKDKILKIIKNITETYDIYENPEKFTSSNISQLLNLKRNTVSSYLNQLVNENKLIKINSRPVYFMDKETVQKKYKVCLDRNVLNSLEELLLPGQGGNKDVFESIIGYNGSLREVIGRFKISALYPNKGLPLLIEGATGVGKSFFAQLIYEFSEDRDVIKSGAPFIMFNCAQYYNNPELLSSNLFGYVKGSFTGANEDKKGMLEMADNGVLFLDEVHRLNAEGQEKLFTFMDTGKFRRIGESSGWRNANVRLIFATTEETSNYMLDTFYRRIPIIVHIPDLEERGPEEKLRFIYYFFLEQSKLFKKNIKVSKQVIDYLVKYRYKGNIGELMNVIKYACGSAYLESASKEEIAIRMLNLPEEILKEPLKKYIGLNNKDDVLISPENELKEITLKTNKNSHILTEMFLSFFDLYTELKNKKINEIEFEKSIFKNMNLYMDKLIFKYINNKNVILNFTIKYLKEIIDYIEISTGVKLYANSVYTISYYLYYKNIYSIFFDEHNDKRKEKLYSYLKKQYKKEFNLSERFIKLLEQELDIRFFVEDYIYFIFYFRSLNLQPYPQNVKAVILCHGFSTASSIANVCNRILGKNIYEAFDMPVDVSMSQIAEIVNRFIKKEDTGKSLLIMVDTGSLREIYTELSSINIPVGIINNVTTQMALDVGSKILQNMSLENIMNNAAENNKTIYKIIYPAVSMKNAIITTCMTGIGTAVKIKQLLEDSINRNDQIEILAINFNKLKCNGLNDEVFKAYNVLAIIGTDNPKVKGIKYIPLEKLIEGKEEGKLENIFGNILTEEELVNVNNNIIRNFSLERVINSLTIINTECLIKDIENSITELELSLNKKFENELKISLYVHISCLVERLIRGTPIKNYDRLDWLKRNKNDFIKSVQISFSNIEDKYGIKIVLPEIGIIYEIISNALNLD